MEPSLPSPLHWSQKLFWVVLSIAIVVLLFPVVHTFWINPNLKVAVAGVELSSERATKSVEEATRKLEKAREDILSPYFDLANDRNNVAEEIGDGLKLLGVTQQVLDEQRARLLNVAPFDFDTPVF